MDMPEKEKTHSQHKVKASTGKAQKLKAGLYVLTFQYSLKQIKFQKTIKFNKRFIKIQHWIKIKFQKG